MNRPELKSIVLSIVNSDSLSEYIASVTALSRYYKQATANPDFFNITNDNEAALKGGNALSTYHAAACTDDHVRTAVFIKGIYQAITSLCRDFPQKRINILYAGCGPYATLLLPLLTLFNKDNVEAVLLDINASSVQSVNNLIAIMGLGNYRLTVIEANAITYTKPEGWEIDLLICETMHYALTSEPQVAITRNLSTQLLSHSIMVPQEINISLGYSFFSKEPFLKSANDTLEGRTEMQPYQLRGPLGRIFSINKELFRNGAGNSAAIESATYPLPDDYGNCPDICIYTELVIFDGIELKTAESYITNPYCIAAIPNFAAHRAFRLVYDYSETPRWEFIPIA